MGHGFSRTDVVAGVAVLATLGCVGLVVAEPGERGAKLQDSLSNLRAIGIATGQYRADNNAYLPFDAIRGYRQSRQGQVQGWADWFSGGKNNNGPAWSNTPFDIEAADRPLNPYVFPTFRFSAPPFPQQLPRDAPARLEQAKTFRDPADALGHQQRWPQGNNRPAVSCYDDVGTSYLINTGWWDQMQRLVTGFERQLNEGTRRMAVEQGVDPARFVHFYDEIAGLVYNIPSGHIPGNHGVENTGVTLFADGHAALIRYRGSNSNEARRNADYSLEFEDLGRGVGGRTPADRMLNPELDPGGASPK